MAYTSTFFGPFMKRPTVNNPNALMLKELKKQLVENHGWTVVSSVDDAWQFAETAHG